MSKALLILFLFILAIGSVNSTATFLILGATAECSQNRDSQELRGLEDFLRFLDARYGVAYLRVEEAGYYAAK